jgi:hypothetical protein
MNRINTLFDKAFPLRQTCSRKTIKANWITQCKIIQSIFKKRMTLSKETRLYIATYKSIYKRVTKEAKQWENDRFLLQATNKPKAVWKVINNELSKPSTIKQDIMLVTQSEEIVDLNRIAELFNAYFCEMPVNLLKNSKLNNIPTPEKHHICIKGCNKSIFLTPITENEVVKVAKCLKNKFATGSDDIPDYVVKQCTDYLKKPLTDTHIYIYIIRHLSQEFFRNS